MSFLAFFMCGTLPGILLGCLLMLWPLGKLVWSWAGLSLRIKDMHKQLGLPADATKAQALEAIRALQQPAPPRRLRLAVCGYGRHGKHTVARFLADRLGLRYKQSTSEAAADVVFAKLGKRLGYKDAEEAWLHRHAHREEWASIIWDYNAPDGLTLYREMISENDILEGIRRRTELAACRPAGLVDFAIWVDASKRLPPESSASCEIGPEDCDLVVDNNGTVQDLKFNLSRLIETHPLFARK